MGHDFDEALGLARRALDLAERHFVPPVPKAFEVWFSYAGGLNATIRARIDRAIDIEGGVPATLIHRLHEEVLSDVALGDGVARIGDRMGSDLAEVIDLIEDSSAASDSYARSIRQIDESLGRGVGEGELRRRVQQLRQANRDHAAAMSRFSDGIAAMRAQFTTMEKELRDLRQSVLIDHATQLPNRRRFDEALDAAISRARRNREPLAVILADIDHFRAFNERWGKVMGDQLLLRLASVLRQVMRETDLPARFGADEVALILPKTGLEAARGLADTLREQFGRLQLVRSDNREPMANMTLSVAVTLVRAEDTSLRIAARLDDYLLRAKEAGHNTVWSAA